MKLVLFLCLVVVCLVATSEGLRKKYRYGCENVDCYRCNYFLDDCFYCCDKKKIDCENINCYLCDIIDCGDCC
ncbi:unnamed protein product [Nezara viridula]|uniref:Neuropeptide n=1 Tax=Nezara viridula TaxID=85310 RepID=A0A9P0HRQ0_NEZVI|nr:unnamed protein product [Nezara viridula]